MSKTISVAMQKVGKLPTTGKIIDLELADDRSNEIIEFFISGETLETIAGKNNLSKRRIQQILSKFGFKKEDGGAIVAAECKHARTNSKRKRWIETFYHCSEEFYDSLKLITPYPVTTYIYARQDAKMAGIDWAIKIEDWWTIWEASKCWNKSGAEQGTFCMGRRDLSGPYSTENCSIEHMNVYRSNVTNDRKK